MKVYAALITFFSLLVSCNCRPLMSPRTSDNIPEADCGTLESLRIYSCQLEDSIDVDVWLPESYFEESDRFPVIYMPDGQNLFDRAVTYSGEAWEIDSVMNAIEPKAIVVGIHNRGDRNLRASDYFPENVVTCISDTALTAIGRSTGEAGLLGNRFLNFIVFTLKPEIDRRYRTLPDRANTFAMGSSMGALVSVYALCEYPHVFGGAACLSTHWIGSMAFDRDWNVAEDSVCSKGIMAYLRKRLPEGAGHRLYMDRGTVGLDSLYGRWHSEACDIARANAYSESAGNLMTDIIVGAAHNEASWRERVAIPLKFLLEKRNSH